MVLVGLRRETKLGPGGPSFRVEAARDLDCAVADELWGLWLHASHSRNRCRFHVTATHPYKGPTELSVKQVEPM